MKLLPRPGRPTRTMTSLSEDPVRFLLWSLWCFDEMLQCIMVRENQQIVSEIRQENTDASLFTSITWKILTCANFLRVTAVISVSCVDPFS